MTGTTDNHKLVSDNAAQASRPIMVTRRELESWRRRIATVRDRLNETRNNPADHECIEAWAGEELEHLKEAFDAARVAAERLP